jgi:hypothetical protein
MLQALCAAIGVLPWSAELMVTLMASAAGVAVFDRATAAAAQSAAEVALAAGGQGAQQPGRRDGAAHRGRNQEGRVPSGVTLCPITLWVHTCGRTGMGLATVERYRTAMRAFLDLSNLSFAAGLLAPVAGV